MSGKETINWKRESYPVRTKHASHGALYKTMFGGRDKPLCNVANVAGCEEAVAVTSWSYAHPDVLYGKDGQKLRIDTTCDIRVLMPKWTKLAKASDATQESVKHFMQATETHEEGHGMACKSLSGVVQAFARHMPERIQPENVDTMNRAFVHFIRNFYIKMARATDRKFDEYTKHGGLQDAAFPPKAPSKPISKDEDYDDMEMMFDPDD